MTPFARFAHWFTARKERCAECSETLTGNSRYCSDACANAAMDRTAI